MIGPDALSAAVTKALADAGLPDRDPTFERPKNRDHGDWSTNVALTMAKQVGKPPREVAQQIVDALGDVDGVTGIELAGPGFINFRLATDALGAVVKTVVAAGEDRWGRNESAAGRRVNIEFVSANPTGPLHVGHGRWVASGDALARVMEANGWEVTREYYLNDAGNQILLFGDSVAARMVDEEVPEGGYQGAYVTEIADELSAAGMSPEDLDAIRAAAVRAMTAQIRTTMESIGISIDVWFSERSLHDAGRIDEAIADLRERGHVFDEDGAVWLRTTEFGDDKDRVLIKADGIKTYFAADTAYLASKVDRGFELAVYLLGADHHGYIGRMKAIAQAEGVPEVMEIIIGQNVNLLRDGEPVKMGKRSGNFVTLDELVDEVGPDATRYTFLRSSMDTPMDFDIARVVSAEKSNPVHYINYSYARIAGIGRKAADIGFDAGGIDDVDLSLLEHDTERELVRQISTLPEIVVLAAEDRSPHRVARFAEGLADAFHRFYDQCKVIDDSAPELSQARFWLCEATRVTVAAALGMLGVTPRERM